MTLALAVVNTGLGIYLIWFALHSDDQGDERGLRLTGVLLVVWALAVVALAGRHDIPIVSRGLGVEVLAPQGQLASDESTLLGLPMAALVTAVASIAVAVFTAVVLYVREYFTRKYDRRRLALLDVQDAAADLRKALRKYGRQLLERVQDLPVGQAPDLVIDFRVDEDEREDAYARLDVRLARLGRVQRDVAVGQAVEAWRDIAAEHFSARQPIARKEADAWTKVNNLVRKALR